MRSPWEVHHLWPTPEKCFGNVYQGCFADRFPSDASFLARSFILLFKPKPKHALLRIRPYSALPFQLSVHILSCHFSDPSIFCPALSCAQWYYCCTCIPPALVRSSRRSTAEKFVWTNNRVASLTQPCCFMTSANMKSRRMLALAAFSLGT